jgi:hypothetical protein
MTRSKHLDCSEMDNILKLVLSVIAFAGLLVAFIPNKNPLAEPVKLAPKPPVEAKSETDAAGENAASQATASQPAPAPSPAPQPVIQSTSQDIAFGQPMLDPTPPGQQMQNQQQQPANGASQEGASSGIASDPGT